MREPRRWTGRVLQWGLLGLFLVLLVPIGVAAARKLESDGSRDRDALRRLQAESRSKIERSVVANLTKTDKSELLQHF